MPSFKAILFDLGGTLLYFDGVWPEVVRVRVPVFRLPIVRVMVVLMVLSLTRMQ